MTSTISRPVYVMLFSLLAVVYIIGLFLPLFDDDPAHHADIALHMYLTGDYVSLIDNGNDYLDKPHLLFWLSALSYHVFGVTSFAYKLPSFLFTIIGTWSVYRCGKTLHNEETGRLAALIAASAFSYILANNDVRMDAIITAAGIFTAWQGIEWVRYKKLINACGMSIGLAVAFCTKGMGGMIAPVLFILFYLVYSRRLKDLFHLHILYAFLLFAILISPVLYCYYLQFDLHPEKVIRDKSGWSGIRFILWDQLIERYEGKTFGPSRQRDFFYYFHTFLWAFAPWSILAYLAAFSHLKPKNFYKEWITTATFIGVILLISFSGFKLPHYLNVALPFSSILVADYLLDYNNKSKSFQTLQTNICLLCALIAILMNFWIFPINRGIVMIGLCVFIIAGFIAYKKASTRLSRLITLSVMSSALFFFLLNSNFYPQLLTYQGGNEIAIATRQKVNPKNVYFWPGMVSHAYSFYTHEPQKDFSPTVMIAKDTIWILAKKRMLGELKQSGFQIENPYWIKDYGITKLKFNFINPMTRKDVTDSMMLVQVK